MKRKPTNNDPFGIQENKNSIRLGKYTRRTDEVEMDPCGESSPYQEWVDEVAGGYDPIDPDEISDEAAYGGELIRSEEVEMRFRALRRIYPALPSRQQELVRILLTGQTDQGVIATMMGNKQPNVAKMLASLRKKILAELGYKSVTNRVGIEEGPCK